MAEYNPNDNAMFRKCSACPSPMACRERSFCNLLDGKLQVTRNGVPVADQRKGVEEFKAACVARPLPDLLDWILRHTTLHLSVEATYVVDGYVVAIWHSRSGSAWHKEYKADTLREAFELAMKAHP